MYDLHVHTTCSDGKYSKLELLKKMNDRGFECVSFTDHNYFSNDCNLLNTLYYNQYLKQQNVELINGVELDIKEYPRLHILGYDIKNSDLLENVLTAKALENKEICKLIVKKIHQYYNIMIPFEKLEQIAFNTFVTKNIIVQWLIDNGFAKNVYEAGMLYTSKYSPCYEERSSLNLQEAIDLIKKCGGIPIMAHPSSIKYDDKKLVKFVSYLKDLGIEGIEVFNADKTSENELLLFLKIAEKLGLLMTSGSDFHREEETKVLGVDNNYSNSFIKLVRERKHEL